MNDRTPARIERDRLMAEARARLEENERKQGCDCKREPAYNEMEGSLFYPSPNCPLHKWMLEK